MARLAARQAGFSMQYPSDFHCAAQPALHPPRFDTAVQGRPKRERNGTIKGGQEHRQLNWEREMSSTIPRLLTVREACKATGLQKWRMYELIKQGKGPRVMHVGRTLRVSEAALVAWIEEQETSST